jgi:hypothetical protein
MTIKLKLHEAIATAARVAMVDGIRHDVWQNPENEDECVVVMSSMWHRVMTRGELDSYQLVGSATPASWESNV